MVRVEEEAGRDSGGAAIEREHIFVESGSDDRLVDEGSRNGVICSFIECHRRTDIAGKKEVTDICDCAFAGERCVKKGRNEEWRCIGEWEADECAVRGVYPERGVFLLPITVCDGRDVESGC